jgi:hypothetical protein
MQSEYAFNYGGKMNSLTRLQSIQKIQQSAIKISTNEYETKYK